jgi:hypothetical protein
MLPFQRMRRLCPWKPHVKKGSVEYRHRQKIPQYVGNPGWLVLTHSEQGDPVALFVDKHDKPVSVPIILDERMFSDTVLRVIQMKPSVYMACDIRYLNGTNVYDKMSYTTRRALLERLLDAFHTTELTALVTDAPYDAILHGFECYDDEPGTLGVFLPARE